jgi:uncharacterized protein YjiS (DUF1127 family)
MSAVRLQDNAPTQSGSFTRQRRGLRLFAIIPLITAWSERSRQRKVLRELAEHGEEHLLRDIGLDRSQAMRESRKWFWQPDHERFWGKPDK